MSTRVTVDNFVAIESSRMFAALQAGAGGINTFRHNPNPAPIDEQTVVRLNRDTLYSWAIVDLAEGARLTLPDGGGRYISAMLVNEQHLINKILHEPGTHELRADELGSRYVLVGVRILVDPADAEDLAAVAALQTQVTVDAASAVPYVVADHDPESLEEVRGALLTLARGVGGYHAAFGSADEVEPVRHLIGAASGWGGLPESEAVYVGVDPDLPRGEYEMRMADVPVDAFWSVSVYNAEGYFLPNASERYTLNSITAAKEDDGSIIVRFTADPATTAVNAIPVPEGWNLLIRLYRPRDAYFDGSWTVPPITG